MSLREWYAGKAILGVMAICNEDDFGGLTFPQYAARRSFEIADAMITEGKKGTP